MVKKDHPPLITKLDFPWLPLLVLATAFVLLLLTLSRYYQPSTSIITLTPTPVPTVIPTPAWQTYRNEKFKFSLTYPTNWELKESKGYDNFFGFYISFSPTNTGQFPVLVTINSNRKPVSYEKPKETLINNINWLEYALPRTCSPEECTMGSKEYITKHNDDIVTISSSEDSYEMLDILTSTINFF